MGKVIKTFYEDTIPDAPDRERNVIRVEESNRPGQFHIHYRNLKIQLDREQAKHWKGAFTEAKEAFKDFLVDDIA